MTKASERRRARRQGRNPRLVGAGTVALAALLAFGVYGTFGGWFSRDAHAQAGAAFDLPLHHGVLPEDMRELRVQMGDIVTLRWTTDAAIVVHVHGYDIEMPIDTASGTTMEFAANIAGRFAVETHAPGDDGHSHAEGTAAHDHGTVAEGVILYIEVHP